jgi:hypothetical protein
VRDIVVGSRRREIWLYLYKLERDGYGIGSVPASQLGDEMRESSKRNQRNNARRENDDRIQLA